MGPQNAQQIMQSESLGASGDLLAASRFQDCEKVRAFGSHLGAIWSHLDDLGCHFDAHWILQGVHKSSFFE